MSSPAEARFEWRVDLGDEAATRSLAAELTHILLPGDLVTLSGDLGSGKTTFARAMIETLTGDRDIEVPSPTFTLMQIYQSALCPIVHADLYRLKGPDELAQLGWDEAAEGALVLVEWADRAGDQLPADRLDVALRLDMPNGPQARAAVLSGYGAFAARLERARAIHTLLAASGWGGAARSFMQGDASARAYERLMKTDGARAILMISPPRPDGPPIRHGKPYSALARLADNIVPFVAVDHALLAQGLSAPVIMASDLRAGVAILEDLGAGGVTDENGPIPERYAEAAAALALLHHRDLPAILPVGTAPDYKIPAYDLDALLIEVELLAEWYLPSIAHSRAASGAQAALLALWKTALAQTVFGKSTWTLRDYHSPNLIWLAEREGLRRVGIIDFQDCVIGNPAYDVVSLLQDARVDVSDALELRLLSHYARKRREADADFSMEEFAAAYAVLGAQRATKILGIFARLDQRDGKPQYLAHLPRVERYLAKNLAHPAMAELKSWYETHAPRIFAPAA